MILKNKINLIWYGRGNLTEVGECDSFDLQSIVEPNGSRPSNLIEMVYRVASNAQGNSGWQQWTSLDFLAGNIVNAEFTSLECGHLYLVIMQDGEGSPKSINIPEAIVADHDTATTTIDDAPLVVLPDNVVETDEEEEPVVAFECLPNADWNIYSSGSNAGEMTNSSDTAESNKLQTQVNFDGAITAGTTFTLGIKNGVEWKSASAEAGVSITSPVALGGSEGGIFNINLKAKEVDDNTEIRINVLNWEVNNELDDVVGDGAVGSSEEVSVVGCYTATIVNNQGVWEKIGESTSPEDTAEEEPVDEEPVDEEPVDEEPVEESNETYASCLGFADGDAVNSYRLRYTKSETPTSADFKLYQKTADEQIEITEVTDTTHAFIFSMVPDMIDGTLEKDFSIFFSAPTEAFAVANIVIMYPEENMTIAFSADSTDTGELTVSRIAIYDAERVAGECADFVPVDGSPNQFTGSSMV